MQLSELCKRDNEIMRVMKISDLRHVIAFTDKGELTLKLEKGQSEAEYRFVLDAVPYPDKENKELLKLFDGILFDLENRTISSHMYTPTTNLTWAKPVESVEPEEPQEVAVPKVIEEEKPSVTVEEDTKKEPDTVVTEAI